MEKINLTKPEASNFVDLILRNGGEVANTGFTNFSSHFPSYCNPSIFWDEQTNQFLCNQRTVSYFIHGTSKDNYDSWGALHYVIRSDRYNWLETVNYLGTSNDPMQGFDFKKIEMKERKHQWEFHGLEDIRLVRWENKLYAIGVRRDDNPTGIGRMEMCELDENFNEIRSVKLKAVDEKNTYCVKNWMPITDMPYHFIDTANPLRIVKADPETGDIEVVVEKPKADILKDYDMARGSSHCIPFDGGHLCIVHTCQMYYTGNNRKYARYLHAFIQYDSNWNIKKVSPLFSFDDFMIEFCCGMTQRGDDIYISFALQDNMSYILKTDVYTIFRFVDGDLTSTWYNHPIWGQKPSQEAVFDYAMSLYKKKDFAGAYTWFQKLVDMFDDYNARYMLARTVADMGARDNDEIALWVLAIDADKRRPEAYMGAAGYYRWRNHYAEAAHFAKMAMEKYVSSRKPLFYYTEEQFHNLYKWVLSETADYDIVDKSLKMRRAF